MDFVSPNGFVCAYSGAYDGNLGRLRKLTTEEVIGEYEDVQFGSGLAETLSYFFNPARRGLVDAASTVLHERAIDLSEELSGNDHFHERL